MAVTISQIHQHILHHRHPNQVQILEQDLLFLNRCSESTWQMIKFSQCTIEGSLHAVTDPSPRSFFDTDSSWATWFNHPFIQLAIPSMPRRNATTSCPIPKKNDVACGAKCGMKMKNVTMILTNIQNDRRVGLL